MLFFPPHGRGWHRIARLCAAAAATTGIGKHTGPICVEASRGEGSRLDRKLPLARRLLDCSGAIMARAGE